MINAVDLATGQVPELLRQIAAVVFGTCNDGPGFLELTAKHFEVAEVNVFGVRRKGVRNAGQPVSKHRNPGWTGGKVRMEVIHQLAR